MIRPADGCSKRPLATNIMHRRDFKRSGCDTCHKKPRIWINIADLDADGLYVFYEIDICLKCLRVAKNALDSKNTVQTGYLEQCDHKLRVCGTEDGYHTCNHCDRTGLNAPTKSSIQFGEDYGYDAQYINLCSGCIDWLISRLEREYRT